jgi:hypothetical protein
LTLGHPAADKLLPAICMAVHCLNVGVLDVATRVL